MKYKFRLVFFHSRPGFFRIDEKSIEYPLNEELVIQIGKQRGQVLHFAIIKLKTTTGS